MKKIRLVSVIGARPQFIKAAAVSRALKDFNKKKNVFREVLLHTGQHYDFNMSERFFRELHIAQPKYNLGIRETSHARQIAKMMMGIEEVLLKEKPDAVLVYGDTNTTLAAALSAKKAKVPLAHIEAGLRSFNYEMAEEINRIVVDRICDYLFCPTKTAAKNLRREGIRKNVFNVGDVMYDSIILCLGILRKTKFKYLISGLRRQNKGARFASLNLLPQMYYLATIHRAENTDNPLNLSRILSALDKLDLPVIIPIHPRTKKAISKNKISTGKNLYFIAPVSYIEMLNLEKNAKLVLTDSGGVQKEAAFLNVPCVTLRNETEWVETIQEGRNLIVGANQDEIVNAVFSLRRTCKKNLAALFGRGQASQKIVQILAEGTMGGV